MTEPRDLLFELGTEELPSSELKDLLEQLEPAFTSALLDARIERTHGKETRPSLFATPRRLAIRVHGVASVQSSKSAEHRGPPVNAAFDADGNPTRAAEGFARRHGVSVAALERRQVGKAEYLFHVEHQPGRATVEMLPSVVETALERLQPRKRMRWGVPGASFPRPVHWAVLLFGDEVVETALMGVTSGRSTRGHRFHHPAEIELDRPADYERRLREPGHVIANFDERAQLIREQVSRAARDTGGEAELAEDLVTEVASLVEWPVALAGRFDPRFLEVPPEALVAVMKDHQKYFPVRDAGGNLLPAFVTVSNIDSAQPEMVRAGNERVIEPRLADAEFFWKQDRRRPLEARLAALDGMVFQRRLGTLHDRSRRISAGAGAIAEALGADRGAAERAGLLSKCDLLTEMVGEFPELQGIMGGYYARHDGEPEPVAQAIAEHYRPAFAGDALPATPAGQAVALADRLDVLVGIFAIGRAPSGDKDPFALRRAALGALRVLIEGGLDLDLERALTDAANQYDPPVEAAAAVPAVFDFMMDRLRVYYSAHGFGADLFEAVRVRRPVRPLDFDARIRALHDFRDRAEAESLTEASKRIHNILRKAGVVDAVPDERLLREPAERELAAQVETLAAELPPLLSRRDYQAAMTRLAGLARPLARFFDEVLVMDEDPAVRGNRIALLDRAHGLFLDVADLSCLQGG